MDDTVTKYQKFVENFLSSVNSADQLPVKIIVPTTTKAEVKGTVTDWILQYLYSWSCPRSFISPLAKIILDEVKPSLDTAVCPFYNEQQGVFTPIPLMQFVIGKIRDICQKFVDGELQYPEPPSDQPQYLSVFATKNRRRCMEDCHVIISDLNVLFDIKTIKHANYYAVFDGHNGSGAALYSSAHLHQFLVESQFYPMYPDQALSDAFKITDRHLLEKDDTQFKRSGTTAVCVLWHRDENMLYTAWAGDSEAILAKKGKIFPLVEPHKAAREDERQRISDLKGVVLFWGSSWRVNGQLAISRAIGDSEHKPHVSSTPDIVSVQLDGDEDFVILACDGLWDSVKYEEAAQTVYNHVQLCPDNYDQVSQILAKHAKTAGSDDNITVIVVFLKDPHKIKLPADSMETATAESFSTSKQNGSSFCSIGDIKNNFDHANDDFGPETNVDDDLISQAVSAKKSFTTFDKLSCNNPFGDLENHKTKDETDSTKIETLPSHDKNNAVSDDSDDEEWNYIKGEAKAANSETNNLEKSPCSELDTSMRETDYPLNPDAAEFVPLSPTSSKKSFDADENPTSPLTDVTNEVRKLLLNDEIVASSPLKGQEKSLDAIDVPSLNDFASEIRKRPSNIMPDFDSDSESHEADNETAPTHDGVASLDDSPGFSETNFSTKAMIGDDSYTADRLKDVNDVIDQSAPKCFEEFDDHHLSAFSSRFEASSVVENGLSDGEDQFPSIVEKSVAPSESSVPSNDLAVDREVPAFSEKRDSAYEFPSLDPNDEVVSHHMTGFGDSSQSNSMVFCGTRDLTAPNNGQPMEQDAELFSFRDEKSDVSEKSQPSFAASNPFAGEHLEKETFEEKELDVAHADETDLLKAGDLNASPEPTEMQFGKQDVPDFMHEVTSPSNLTSEFTDNFCNFRPSKEQSHPFDDDSKEPISMFQTSSDLHPVSNGIEELVCVQEKSHVDVEAPVPAGKIEHVEVHVERPATPDKMEFVEKHEAPEKPEDSKMHEPSAPSADSFAQFERQLSEQIVDVNDDIPRQFSAEECDRLEDVTVLSDCGDPDEPIVSFDAEAPYIHDCGRLDEKPGSVHHHTTHSKHYSDLLPDVTSTMESDKLESELRESEAKVEPEPVPLVELPAKTDDTPVAPVEVPKSDDAEATTQPSAVAVAVTASAVTAAAVATAAVAATAISDTKKVGSVIKKPEGAAKPSKPSPKPSTTLTKARPAAPKLDTKKPTVSSTTTKLTSPRTAAPARPAPAKAAPAARTLTAAKPSLSTTRTTLSSSAPKPPVKLSSPAKPKMTTTTSATKATTNGDISKAPARKPLASSSTLRKPSVETKPAVTMSNRVSLAPKVPRTTAGSTTATKGEPAVTASKVSSSLAAPRRPISAPTKVTQKDTKDIANKRLSSAAKSSPTKVSATNGKTESKVNSLSKSAPKTTTSSTTKPSPIKKPTAAAVSSPSQSNSVDHQN